MFSTEIQNEAKQRTFNLLLWGLSGIGKTTLANTIAGKKLYILFDPNGTDVLGSDTNIVVMELTKQSIDTVINSARNKTNPFYLSDVIKKHPDIETIVFDSITTYCDWGVMQKAVDIISKTFPQANITIDTPQQSGYGVRNNILIETITNLQSFCTTNNLNLIAIAHLGEKLNTKQEVIKYSLSLGGKLANNIPLKFSEVWYMYRRGSEIMIGTRTSGMYEPSKTRMFSHRKNSASGKFESEFVWKFDPVTKTGQGISDWINAWKENGFNQIKLPV